LMVAFVDRLLRCQVLEDWSEYNLCCSCGEDKVRPSSAAAILRHPLHCPPAVRRVLMRARPSQRTQEEVAGKKWREK
jgi:hypothetical protein